MYYKATLIILSIHSNGIKYIQIFAQPKPSISKRIFITANWNSILTEKQFIFLFPASFYNLHS